MSAHEVEMLEAKKPPSLEPQTSLKQMMNLTVKVERDMR